VVAGFGGCRCGTRVEGSSTAVRLRVRLPGRALEREPRRSERVRAEARRGAGRSHRRTRVEGALCDAPSTWGSSCSSLTSAGASPVFDGDRSFRVLPATAWSAGFFWRFATRSGLESDGVALLLRTVAVPRARFLRSGRSILVASFARSLVRSSVVGGRVRPCMWTVIVLENAPWGYFGQNKRTGRLDPRLRSDGSRGEAKTHSPRGLPPPTYRSPPGRSPPHTRLP